MAMFAKDYKIIRSNGLSKEAIESFEAEIVDYLEQNYELVGAVFISGDYIFQAVTRR